MLARTLTTVALATAAVLAAPLAGTPLAAQIAPGSQLVFGGIADAYDLGAPGVQLTFVEPIEIDTRASTGSFRSLRGNPNLPVTADVATFVVGAGPQPIRNLFTIGQYRFDLLGLSSSGYGQADCEKDPYVGQKCTPIQTPGTTESPFYLENRASGNPAAPIDAYVAFDFYGTVTGPGGHATDFVGTIGSYVPGLDFLTVLRALEGYSAAEVPFYIPFAGTITAGVARGSDLGIPGLVVTTTPEPGTWALLATGLGGLGLVARRRRRA